MIKYFARYCLLYSVTSLLFATGSAYGGLGARVGAAAPQGDFKDLAGTGWFIEVNATISILPLPFISGIAAFGTGDFGDKEHSYQHEDGPRTQKSSTAFTGGGVGLRGELPFVKVKPFAEVLGRLASIEQDYSSGKQSENSVLESKTKFGYQLTGGILFKLTPQLDAEVGASFTTYPGTKLRNEQKEVEIDIQSLSLFAGIRLGFGL